MWEDDLHRMEKAGISVIRIAEFAWSKVEPREGEFTYEFFDRFLDIVEKTGVKTIFCTPTATPPAWLTERYPEVLNADINGHKFWHGSRRHYNYNSKVYREKCRTITEKFAEHYASRKCIIGWQIDNELNCEVGEFFSEADSVAFREWVQRKYGTLDAVNEAWGTVFWNQTYTSWDEIYVPRRTCNGAINPHLRLDYFRFISDSCRSFAKEQSDILRKYLKPGDFITTNGMFGHLDNHAMTRESLDVYMYDSYPNFSNNVGREVKPDDLRDRWWSNHLAKTRSISSIFGIMEQQTGANGWNIWGGVPNPRPGQIRLWTIQSIMHGADYVSFFRWRTCTFGTEMYWHGILDYSSIDNERLSEVTDTCHEMAKLEGLAGRKYYAKVAVLDDHDNIFDAEIDKWHGSLYEASANGLFNALSKTHTAFDYVYFFEGGLSKELSDYKVVFYPHPVITDDKRVAALKKYVENGGILVLGARAGQKDMNGRCEMRQLPAEFAELTGAKVKEYSFIQPDKEKINAEIFAEPVDAFLFADRIEDSPGAQVIGKYKEDYFAGDTLLTVNNVGEGKVYYYGSVFTEEVAEVFLKKLGVAETFGKLIKVPAGCEVAKRGDYLFVLNYLNEECRVDIKGGFMDAISGRVLTEDKVLKPYEAMVLKVGNFDFD
ncbi:MAG: beta-galactosidase [Lachnospiraceae bacterium]|nr:beta-galactosidase [Lachnospiraceae bacterium]